MRSGAAVHSPVGGGSAILLCTIIAASAILPFLQLTLAAPQAAASVRADKWRKEFPESGCDDPVDGRRVNVVITGLPSGLTDAALTSVKVSGQEGLNLDTSDKADLTYFDWFRAHTSDTALWISFHTRNTKWLGSSVTINATDTGSSTLFTGSVPLVTTDNSLTLAYFATRAGGSEALLHVHNNDDKNKHTLGAVSLDGIAVNVPSAYATLPPNGHLVLPVKTTTPKGRGAVWTVTLAEASSLPMSASLSSTVAANNAPAGFGGRNSLERFPVETWAHSTDCAIPGGNNDAASAVQEMGLDSVFVKPKDFAKCSGGKSLIDAATALANTSSWCHIFTDSDTAISLPSGVRSRVLDAVLMGDEVDGKLDADHLRKPLGDIYKLTRAAPDVISYQGSKTNHNIGAFAGMTDVQGSDAYAAACAPTMLAVVHTLPLSYPYDYLRNARDNTVPLPFWGYAQLYSEAWSYQADADELICQLGQLIASGTKAAMFFQTDQKAMKGHKTSEVGEVIRSLQPATSVMREGDIEAVGVSSSASDGDLLVAAIASDKQILVVAVSTKAHGYSNLLCHTEVLDRHWTFSDLNVDKIELDFAQNSGLKTASNWKELANGKAGDISGSVKVHTDGDKVTLGGVRIAAERPVRLFLADVSAA